MDLLTSVRRGTPAILPSAYHTRITPTLIVRPHATLYISQPRHVRSVSSLFSRANTGPLSDHLAIFALAPKIEHDTRCLRARRGTRDLRQSGRRVRHLLLLHVGEERRHHRTRLRLHSAVQNIRAGHLCRLCRRHEFDRHRADHDDPRQDHDRRPLHVRAVRRRIALLDHLFRAAHPRPPVPAISILENAKPRCR